MTVNNTDAGNITDWAGNAIAGAGVLAEISAVPEPATALCAASMLRWCRGAKIS